MPHRKRRTRADHSALKVSTVKPVREAKPSNGSQKSGAAKAALPPSPLAFELNTLQQSLVEDFYHAYIAAFVTAIFAISLHECNPNLQKKLSVLLSLACYSNIDTSRYKKALSASLPGVGFRQYREAFMQMHDLCHGRPMNHVESIFDPRIASKTPTTDDESKRAYYSVGQLIRRKITSRYELDTKSTVSIPPKLSI